MQEVSFCIVYCRRALLPKQDIYTAFMIISVVSPISVSLLKPREDYERNVAQCEPKGSISIWRFRIESRELVYPLGSSLVRSGLI